MADCPSYNCSDLEAYDPGDSCATYNGGVQKVILYKCGLDTDWTNGTEVQAAINAGDAVLLENVKINWDAPSAETSSSYVACVTDTPSIYNHSVTFIDRNVQSASITFYNSANAATGYTLGGALFWECDAERVTQADYPMLLTGGRVMPDQNTDRQRFEHTLTWRTTSGSMPIISTPAGIFN